MKGMFYQVGHPAWAQWCREIDAIAGAGTCARADQVVLAKLYFKGMSAKDAAPFLAHGTGQGNAMLIGQRGRAAPVMRAAAVPVARPVAQPVARPVLQPVARPVVAPIARPVAAPISAPVASPALAAPPGGMASASWGGGGGGWGGGGGGWGGHHHRRRGGFFGWWPWWPAAVATCATPDLPAIVAELAGVGVVSAYMAPDPACGPTLVLVSTDVASTSQRVGPTYAGWGVSVAAA